MKTGRSVLPETAGVFCYSVFCLYRSDLVYPALMALVAGEGGGYEGIHKIEGRAFAYYPCTETENVGIVVLA